MSGKMTNLISRSEYCVPTETLRAGSENRPVTIEEVKTPPPDGC